MYSKVDRDCWRLDESRQWYCKNASDEVIPDMELESYGFTAIGVYLALWRGSCALARLLRTHEVTLVDAEHVHVSMS